MKKDYTQVIKQVGSIVDLWMPLRMEYAQIPGMAVAIAHKDKVVYAKGFGYGDKAKKQKIDSKTLFRIASISKTFTAVAIMQLVEKKKLRLEDPVYTYLPWFTAQNKKGNASAITIEDLVSHSSGIFRDGDTDHWGDGKFPKELKESFTNDSLLLKRTSSFKYSNYGFAVLGKVIEEVSGMSYEDYVHAHIMKPLGMRSTFVDYDAAIPGHASGFERRIPGRTPGVFPHYKTHAYAPATGFSSSAEDLSKFAASFFTSADTKILSSASRKKMVEKEWDTGVFMKHGMGLDIFQVGKKKLYGHSGGFLGFSLMMLFDPKEEISVVVLINSTSAGAGSIAHGIFGMLQTGMTLQKPGKQHDYSSYIGIYRDHWRDTVCAQLGSSLIAFSANNDAPAKFYSTLVPIKGGDAFTAKTKDLFAGPEETVVFADKKGGKFHTMRSFLGRSIRI